MFEVKVTKRQPRLALAAIGAAMIFVLAMSAARGAGASPFSAMAGSWSGPGTITTASGAKENIRCRANYQVDGSGVNLKAELRCSSDAFKFELQSTVAHNRGEVSGFWNELTKRVGGTVSGKAGDGKVEVLVAGPFSATIELNTRADQQAIVIESPGSDFPEVAIALSRSGSRQAALK